MYLQTVLHVEAGAEHIRDVWRRDPWFSDELLRQCGRDFCTARAVEPWPAASDAIGGWWLDFGDAGRMGLLPVSDGTEMVLQLSESFPQNLWGRISYGAMRRLRRFAAAAKVRLELKSTARYI